MQILPRLLCIVSIVAVPFASTAESADASKIVPRLMAKSGPNNQLEQFPQLVVAGLEQAAKQRGDITEAGLSKLRRAIAAGYKPDDMRAEVSRYLVQHLSATDMSAVLQWLESP